jgi:uncharacterized membrane protein
VSKETLTLSGVSEVLVIVFDDDTQAPEALAALRRLERQDILHFVDTAVITRDEHGKLHTRNELASQTEVGVVGGAIVGGLMTLLFPGVGILVGALSGGAIGALLGDGIDRKFVKEVSASLQPGTSALMVVINHLDPAVFDALKPYSGKIYHSSLSEDAEERLTRALA